MIEAERAKRAELVGGGEGVGEGEAGHAHDRGGASEVNGARPQLKLPTLQELKGTENST